MRRRVVIVDDDDVMRRGIAELLADRPEIEVLGALTHEEAMNWEEGWRFADVVLVDAADERHQEDQFPGVAVVERIRRRRSRDETLVIVLTGHFFDDAVRRRMREAQADLFYHRGELQEASRLQEAVLHPDGDGHRVPDADDSAELIRHGIVKRTTVNEALEYAREHRLVDALKERSGRPGRAWLGHRKAFNSKAGLNPINADGREPAKSQTEPSLPQIARFLQWATRTKQRSPGEPE